MDQLEQDLSRFKKPAMAAVGGIAAALVVATLPPVYLEKAIGLTGISEIISAAAPPLGNTARGLIAVVAGLVSASVIYFITNRKGGSDMGVALREQVNISSPIDPNWEEEKKSKFSLPKLSLNKKSLTKFLKKPKKQSASDDADKKVMDLSDLPKLRDADVHPDAPARRPISAEADLGSPLPQELPTEIPADMAAQIKPFEQPAEQPVAQPLEQAAAPEGLAMPAMENAPPVEAPAFVADKSLEVPAPSVVAPQVEVAPVSVSVEPAPIEDMSDFSIIELADRLEAGLARLKQIEAITASAAATVSTAPAAPAAAEVAQPVAPQAQVSAPPPLKPVEKTEEEVQAARQADMDAALKAALGTLEKMTAQR